MKVKYVGEIDVMIPTLGIQVKKGDEIEVPEDFSNANFVPVEEKVNSKKKGDNE